MDVLKDSKPDVESIINPKFMRAFCGALADLINEQTGRDLGFMIIVLSDTPDRATALMGNGDAETMLQALREISLSEKANLDVDEG